MHFPMEASVRDTRLRTPMSRLVILHDVGVEPDRMIERVHSAGHCSRPPPRLVGPAYLTTLDVVFSEAPVFYVRLFPGGNGTVRH